MRVALPDDLLEAVSRFVASRAGLDFPRARWPDLERALGGVAAEFGAGGVADCALALLSPASRKEQVESLIERLTVGETYFFREPKAFEALETVVLPALVRARGASEKRLRFWSAGCCTGEEPYSIAIALERALPDLDDWDITILATDINAQFLQKAGEGSYGPWSFRGVSESVWAQYFRPIAGGRLEVLPRIRRRVTFSCVNLVEDVYPSLFNNTNAMDVIFCRNVLMYFTADQAKGVAGKLQRSLVAGGWFFPGGPEAVRDMFGGFTPAGIKDVIVYRKAAQPSSLRMPSEPLHRVARPLSADAEKGVAPPVVKTEPPLEPAESAERARRLADDGRLSEALSACDAAIAGDKLAPAHHYLRGLILEEQGETAEAAAALRRALYLDPRFVAGHVALGNLMRRSARPRDAARCFENARALLRECPPEALLSEADGLSAGRLLAILSAIQKLH